jgi:hypothetical protein
MDAAKLLGSVSDFAKVLSSNEKEADKYWAVVKSNDNSKSKR